MYPEGGITLAETGVTDSDLALELCSTYTAAAQALQPGFAPETFNVRIGLQQLNDVQQAYVVHQNLAPVFTPFTGLPPAPAAILWEADLPDAVQKLFDLQSRLMDPDIVCDGLDLQTIHAKLADGLGQFSYYDVIVQVERSAISIGGAHIKARFRTTCPLNERGNQEGWCVFMGKDYQINFSLYEVARLLHLLQQEVVWRFTNACHQELLKRPGDPGKLLSEIKKSPMLRISCIGAYITDIELGDIIQLDQLFMVIGKRIGRPAMQSGRIEYAVKGQVETLSPVPELLPIYRIAFPQR